MKQVLYISAIPASALALRTRRRIAIRLVPFVFLLYAVAFLDRVNVAYAGLEMSKALGFSDRVFGTGAGIFFLGYFLLEIPGALLVERWSARRWIARIMISWGIITILTAFLHSVTQFYLARFMLGVAEAGFFPGIIIYLTHWFANDDKAKAVAGFCTAGIISNVVGSPLAGYLLGVHWSGIEGWRWLFVCEGVPAIILGTIAFFYLTDWPCQANWLPADERDWIINKLGQEKAAGKPNDSCTIMGAFRSLNIILLASAYFLAATGQYGFILWLPTIFKRLSGFSNLTVSLLVILPYVAALAANLLNSWHSDLTGERHWHAALPLFIGGGALLSTLATGGRLWLMVLLFTIAGASLLSWVPSFWALPTVIFRDSASAAAVGLINSVGNLGGFVGPFILGYLQTPQRAFARGFIYLVCSLFLSGTLIVGLISRTPRHAIGVLFPRY
jgi:ACS family tartrate transporter-like MFS transporter